MALRLGDSKTGKSIRPVDRRNCCPQDRDGEIEIKICVPCRHDRGQASYGTKTSLAEEGLCEEGTGNHESRFASLIFING